MLFFILCLVANLLICSFGLTQPSRSDECNNETLKVEKIHEDYNVIMIFIDPLRTDHLSCYGYHRKTSPYIDKIAQESFIFDNNFATASYTLASAMSVITSLYPKSHGVLYITKDKLSSRIKTLAEIMQAHEYATAWFGALGSAHLDPKIGFGRGFKYMREFETYNLKQTRKDIFDWIGSHKSEKFFLNLHTYKTHVPFFPSLKYKKKFIKHEKEEMIKNDVELSNLVFETMRDELLQGKGQLWSEFGEDLTSELISSNLFQGDFDQRKIEAIKSLLNSRGKLFNLYNFKDRIYLSNFNFEDLDTQKYYQALYDALILEFDSEIIGPLVKKLKDLQLYDKTIIVIFSDHGEDLGEDGRTEHGSNFYETLVHVPLIIKVPWIKQSRRIKELTQTVDILPTLLNLLGITIPYHTQGESLLGLINKDQTSSVREYVFGQHENMSYIRSKEWKLILTGENRKELFYLPSDPKEQQNLYFLKQDVALSLESELKQWQASLVHHKEQEYPFSPEIDEATQERIKKTGYW